MKTKSAILIAEAVAIMVDAIGMKTENDTRASKGLSEAYNDDSFFDIANELREKINQFKTK